MTPNKAKLKKYVRTLLKDFANPDRPTYDEYSGEWDDDQEKYSRPLDGIPKEYKSEVLRLTFAAIIQHLKKHPEFIEVIENNGLEVSWLPKGVYDKLVSIGQELDKLHGEMKNQAAVEKMKSKKVDENSKYLGPTTKVKINKAGWQIPLNKRGFGA